MIKTLIYTTYLFSLLGNLNLNAQRTQISIDTIVYSYYNNIADKNQIIEEYQITNNSEKDYLTWVSLLSVDDYSNDELIFDYFLKIKGDLSFIMWMYSTIIEWVYDIGYTFLKKIPPGKKFTYYIVKTDAKSNSYQNKIVILPKDYVEQSMNQELDTYFKFYDYEPSSVILND